jgi:PAS domain S-box-containing protein
MILEDNFRIRAFSVFVLVMLFITAIYLLLVIPPQKKMRDLQMSKRLTEQKAFVSQRIKQSNQLYQEKIRHFISNQAISAAFAGGDKKRLKNEVQPFMAVLEIENPYFFIINFYKEDNSPFLLMQGMAEVDVPETGFSYVTLTNELQTSHFGYEFCGQGLYYKIVRPLFYQNQYIGCVEFGIRDIEIIEQLMKDFQIVPSAYFRKDEFYKINLDLPDWDYTTIEVFLTYYDDDDLFEEALSSNENLEDRVIIAGGKSYLFSNFGEFRDYADNLLGGLYAGVEVSDIQKTYRNFLKYQITGIALIVIIVLLIFYFFFGYFFEKIYDLKRTLDKKIAERSREIIDTNNQLNLIFNTTSNGMRLIDKDYNILRVNKAFSTMSGYTVEEAEGKKCYELFPSDKCHTPDCSLAKIMMGEEKVEFRSENTNKANVLVPTIQTSVPLRGSDGNIYGIIEDLKDLTELIKTEEALRQSEKEFSMFMDDLPLGVFIKDKDSRALYLNKYMDSVFDKANCLGNRPGDIFPAAIAKRVLREDALVLNGENVLVEEALQDKHGKERIYMTHKFLLSDSVKGKRIGGISIDITRRKEAEKQLNLLSSAVQFTPVCVVITNYEGEIEYVNHAFHTLTGYTFEEVAGKSINMLGSGLHEENFFKEMWDTIKSGNNWHGQVQNQRKNGELYWERLSISPVKDNEGEIRYFIAIKEDNTQQKEFEDRLNEAKEKALESDRLKTAFLTNFSHEIRTPMNAIVGLTELLVNNKIPNAEKLELKNNIQENSRILLKLINDIINISKIDAGLVQAEETECFLNQMLDGLLVEFETKLQIASNSNRKVILKKANPHNDFNIVADEKRLREVFSNLLENAIKFTPEGHIEFGYVLKDENTLLFYVKDTGVGIPEDKLDAVFERFKTADDTLTRTYGGTGLGLAISRSLVELMSGKIWVRSNPNKGSTFFFTLPYKISIEGIERERTTGKHPDMPELSGKTILVADGVNANYLLIEAALKKTHANVLWAKNGKEALEITKFKLVDLVIMDVELAGMSGIDALLEMKKVRQDLPVIMQTAFSIPEQIEKCIQAGCDGYILKPVNIRQLAEKISDFLKQG